MAEVPAVLVAFMFRALESRGLDVRKHTEGLALASVTAHSFGRRVSWDELATFLNRSMGGMSSEEQEKVGEAFAFHNRYIAMILRFLLSARAFYRLAQPANRSAYPHLKWGLEEKGPILIQSMYLPQPYLGCEPFFRGTAGEFRALSTVIGLPPSQVEADVGSHHGVYRIRVPEPETIWNRLRRSGTIDAGREIVDLINWSLSGRASRTRMNARELQDAFGLTHAEARVAVRIARGKRVPEVADEIGVKPGTVRTHLKRTFAKTGVNRQLELARLVNGER